MTIKKGSGEVATKKRRRALSQDMWWENHYMHKAGQEVNTYRRKIREQYGFVVDLTKPL